MGSTIIREANWEYIMSLIDGLFIVVDCPKCGYGMDVELRSVELQEPVFCPCCKVAIQLVDAYASLYGEQEEIDSAIEELHREFKKLNKTFTFKI